MSPEPFEDIELRSQLTWLSTGLICMCVGIGTIIGGYAITNPLFIGSGIGIVLLGICMYAYAFLQVTGNSLTTTTVPSFFSPSTPDYPSPRNQNTDTIHRLEDLKDDADETDD